jgi:hypothetical protein
MYNKDHLSFLKSPQTAVRRVGGWCEMAASLVVRETVQAESGSRISQLKGAVAEAGGQFGNPEEGERPPLEAATKQRLVKTVTENTSLGVIVLCKVQSRFVCLRVQYIRLPIQNPSTVTPSHENLFLVSK